MVEPLDNSKVYIDTSWNYTLFRRTKASEIHSNHGESMMRRAAGLMVLLLFALISSAFVADTGPPGESNMEMIAYDTEQHIVTIGAWVTPAGETAITTERHDAAVVDEDGTAISLQMLNQRQFSLERLSDISRADVAIFQTNVNYTNYLGTWPSTNGAALASLERRLL